MRAAGTSWLQTPPQSSLCLASKGGQQLQFKRCKKLEQDTFGIHIKGVICHSLDC